MHEPAAVRKRSQIVVVGARSVPSQEKCLVLWTADGVGTGILTRNMPVSKPDSPAQRVQLMSTSHKLPQADDPAG